VTTEKERLKAKEATDPGGPVAVACLGHRCAGLHTLAATEPALDRLPELKRAIRSSHAGLLITTGCMGPCHEGAVVGVGHRCPNPPGAPLVVRSMMLLGGMERTSRVAALASWLEQGGPARVPMPTPILAEASLGPIPGPWSG